MAIKNFEEAVNKLKVFLPDYLQEKGIDTSKNFNCIFPGHEDSSPSCNLVGAGTASPRVWCFGCGKSADLFDVVQIMEDRPKVGINWVEDTLKYLAKKYNVDIDVEDLTEEQIYELTTYRAYKAAASLITSIGLDAEKHKRFFEHVERRGWKDATLRAMNVGTVSSYGDFRNSLKQLGFAATFIDEVDLGRKDIFNEENLIFTWHDEKGRPVGFTSRNLSYEERKAEADERGEKFTEPKYNNQRTTGLKCNIFQKGKRLYGIDAALKAGPPLYLFEGQTDVITARDQGILNCAGLAGSSLNTEHIFLLKELGFYDLVLCLDSDATGRKKTKQILEEKLAGHKDLKVRVAILPDGEDPDSFVRKEGAEAFRNLTCWTAFEWRLNQYEETDDPIDICKQMVPFIVNEPSAISREQQCKILATRTGVSQKSITEELNSILDEQSKIKSRERQIVLDRALYELQKSPLDAETILDKTRASLSELTKKHSADLLSCEDFVRSLDQQKEIEEQESSGDVGFELGEDLKELREILRGEWSRDVFMCYAGAPNSGKSGLMSKLAYSIATHNKDVVVIYHTIDDTLNQLLPRFICIAEGSTELTINMVRQPNYWSKERGLKFVDKARSRGYKAIRKLAQEGRLIIKDVSHGQSLSFAENLISYYQDKYPERRIVYILDNIHKLRDFEGKDERVRHKTISEACKNLSLRKRIVFMGTVEYTKLPPGTRPSNYNVAESVQYIYDTNFMAHLYNEVADIPDSCAVFHKGQDWTGKEVILPRVELIIGKNKITEQKTSIWLDFWPAASDFRSVSQAQVIQESRSAKDSKKSVKMELGFEEK